MSDWYVQKISNSIKNNQDYEPSLFEILYLFYGYSPGGLVKDEGDDHLVLHIEAPERSDFHEMVDTLQWFNFNFRIIILNGYMA